MITEWHKNNIIIIKFYISRLEEKERSIASRLIKVINLLYFRFVKLHLLYMVVSHRIVSPDISSLVFDVRKIMRCSRAPVRVESIFSNRGTMAGRRTMICNKYTQRLSKCTHLNSLIN